MRTNCYCCTHPAPASVSHGGTVVGVGIPLYRVGERTTHLPRDLIFYRPWC